MACRTSQVLWRLHPRCDMASDSNIMTLRAELRTASRVAIALVLSPTATPAMGSGFRALRPAMQKARHGVKSRIAPWGSCRVILVAQKSGAAFTDPVAALTRLESGPTSFVRASASPLFSAVLQQHPNPPQ